MHMHVHVYVYENCGDVNASQDYYVLHACIYYNIAYAIRQCDTVLSGGSGRNDDDDGVMRTTGPTELMMTLPRAES